MGGCRCVPKFLYLCHIATLLTMCNCFRSKCFGISVIYYLMEGFAYQISVIVFYLVKQTFVEVPFVSIRWAFLFLEKHYLSIYASVSQCLICPRWDVCFVLEYIASKWSTSGLDGGTNLEEQYMKEYHFGRQTGTSQPQNCNHSHFNIRILAVCWKMKCKWQASILAEICFTF